jgi:hypothetical protein
MTTQQLKKLAHGTKVVWSRDKETASGYVVDLRKSKPKAEPPLVYVQWEDGQRTDGSDDWALEHVSEVR